MLFREQRWANADQLYGFSAECGLKTIMRAHGMAVDGKGVPQRREHRTHIQDLWPVFGTFARQWQLPRYLAQLPTGTPFADWSHHDRYAHRTHFDRAVVSVPTGTRRTTSPGSWPGGGWMERVERHDTADRDLR